MAPVTRLFFIICDEEEAISSGSINIYFNIPSTTNIQSIANNKRRRMTYNNGYNQELLILSDYAQTKYYRETYMVIRGLNLQVYMVVNYGVTSTVVDMAHETGHKFGANHDGSGNDCASGLGSIMGGAE
eukprot:404167_1